MPVTKTWDIVNFFYMHNKTTASLFIMETEQEVELDSRGQVLAENDLQRKMARREGPWQTHRRGNRRREGTHAQPTAQEAGERRQQRGQAQMQPRVPSDEGAVAVDARRRFLETDAALNRTSARQAGDEKRLAREERDCERKGAEGDRILGEQWQISSEGGGEGTQVPSTKMAT